MLQNSLEVADCPQEGWIFDEFDDLASMTRALRTSRSTWSAV
jgi:hypothetical protein